MRNIIITAIITACIAVPVTYKVATKPCSKPVISNVKWNIQGTANPVPLALALADIDTLNSWWGATAQPLHQPCPLKAFTIGAGDLLTALGLDPEAIQCPYPAIRVYFGLRDSASTYIAKLYVVAVDSTVICPSACLGRDHFFMDTGGRVTVNNLPDVPALVLDLNAPCPTTCDSMSPMFLAATILNKN